jgi:hypothetical protein
MPEHPLQLRLDPISGRPGAYTFTCDTTHYPVTLDQDVRQSLSCPSRLGRQLLLE